MQHTAVLVGACHWVGFIAESCALSAYTGHFTAAQRAHITAFRSLPMVPTQQVHSQDILHGLHITCTDVAAVSEVASDASQQ